MNSMRQKVQFLAAILLLLAIVFVVWYVLFYVPGPTVGPDGTLVWDDFGKLVNL